MYFIKLIKITGDSKKRGNIKPKMQPKTSKSAESGNIFFTFSKR